MVLASWKFSVSRQGPLPVKPQRVQQPFSATAQMAEEGTVAKTEANVP